MSETLSNFAVLRLVRDARSTRNAERQLMDALAMRCSPARKYMCWPSYRQLALDTQLDEVTLKRAAKRLEAKNLIRRSVRLNRSNVFFLNVALLQEQAWAVKKAEDAAKRDGAEDEDSPFEQPVVAPAVAEHDDLDGETNETPWITGGAR